MRLSDLAPTVDRMDDLTDLDRDILAFEGKWWQYAGAKDSAIRDQFGMSATRYYQVLNALIDKPAALVHDPMVVKRLRRLRTNRRQRRQHPAGHRLG